MFSGRNRRKNKLNFRKSFIFYKNILSKSPESYSDLKLKTRTRNLKIVLFILSSANLVILAVIAFLFFLNTENNRNFNNKIFQTDRCIEAGDFGKAESLLKNSIQYGKTRKNALILLKRDLIISSHINNFDFFEDISEKYYKKYNRDKRFTKIYLYSLLKNNRIELFFRIFPFKTENDSFLSDLLLQAYTVYTLKSSDLQLNRKISSYLKNNIYYDLLNNRRNPDLYLKAFETERNKTFLNNLVLLYMKNGFPEKALKYCVIINKNDFLSALVYLDNRNYSDSLKIISELPEKNSRIKMIQSDLEMFLFNWKNSRLIYNEVIKSDPFYSNIPLINLIWLEHTEKGTINNLFLNKLLDNFKNKNTEQLLFFIQLRKKYITDENKILQFKEYGGLNDLFILNMDNSSKYLDIMWRFYNKYSTDDDFKIYFIYYLLKTGKYSDLEILLQKSDIKNKSYYYLFNAFYEIYSDEYPSAEKSFFEYLLKNKYWEVFYNISLLEIKKNNYIEAVKYLDMIIGSSDFINDEYLSDIYFWKAYSLYSSRNFIDADDVINKSLLKNRSNIEAKILKTHIESKIVESQFYK